jgi:hypothetical protein
MGMGIGFVLGNDGTAVRRHGQLPDVRVFIVDLFF